MISILNIPKIPQVTGKFAGMRKPQEFLPHRTASGTVIIQSGKSIGTIDLTTGAGMFTSKNCYFAGLVFAEPIKYPPEFVEAVKAAIGTFDSLSEGAPA
jgi:hypothetical protein